MAEKTNNERVLLIAEAMGELNERLVYVGGSVAQYYSNDKASRCLQTTYDVDCVVDSSTYQEYNEFVQELYSKHFRNDQSEGAPMCRFVHQGEIVDVMPIDDTQIGESNRWYRSGFRHRVPLEIGRGKMIYIMSVPFYLATKLEALHSRGGSDYRGAKDFEDIVYVLNSCPDVARQIAECNDDIVIKYLIKEFSTMCTRQNIREEIESAMLEDNRELYVLSAMKDISNLES